MAKIIHDDVHSSTRCKILQRPEESVNQHKNSSSAVDENNLKTQEALLNVHEEQSRQPPNPDSSGAPAGLSNEAKPREFRNFEDILDALGGFGPFQFLIIIALLVFEIPTAFVTFLPIFVGSVPEAWTCVNVTLLTSEVCSRCASSSRYPIPSPKSEQGWGSIVAEWNLVCDEAWVFDFMTSVQMMGMLVGSLVGSQFADWYGRKKGFLAATILLCLGTVTSVVSPGPYVYTLGRFLTGGGITCFLNVSIIGVVEVMPTKWRSLANCIGPTGEGVMILSVLAYFIRPWRTLYWISLALFGMALLLSPFIPESPRWLLKQDRIQDAHKVLQRVAKINGVKGVTEDTLSKVVEVEKAASSFNTGRRLTYIDFMRDKNLRVTSIYNMAIWFSWSFTFYGLFFNIRNVGGDIYLNVFLMGLVNAVGQRTALLFNNRLGRRKALFVSTSFCAGCLVSLATTLIFVEQSRIHHVVTLLCLLGQYGMASARSTIRLLSGESFPTEVRTMALGMSGITSNLAGMLTPQLAFLGTKFPSAPFFIFAVVSVIGSLIAFLMNETMGQPLDIRNVTTEPSVPSEVNTLATQTCHKTSLIGNCNPAFDFNFDDEKGDHKSIPLSNIYQNLSSDIVLLSVSNLIEAPNKS